MTLAIVLFAVVSLVAFVLVAARQFFELNLDSELLPVDMESLAALIDEDQTEYLKTALSMKQFRVYEREQSLVIAEYVKRISHNSRLVIARTNAFDSTDVAAKRQRVEMLNLAMRTRTLCLSVLLRLYLNAYTPWCRSPLQQVTSIHNAASRFIPELTDRNNLLTLHSRT